MCILRPQSLVRALFLVLASLTSVSAQDKQIKVEPAKRTASWKGDDLYREFCAVCHGADAKGDGPAASALKVKPSDLTQISHRSNGKFPTLEVQRAVSGADGVQAHGNVAMPIWGDVFKSISANDSFAKMRITALVDYLKTVQK